MKRFTEAEIQRVRDDNPISEVIGRHVTWDRSKTNAQKGDYWACCPFHNEATPSFHCEDGKGTYKCFGCGAAGDVFRFLKDKEGLDFVEAMERLGGRSEAEPLSPEQIAADEKKRAEKRAEQEAEASKYREEERRKAFGLWRKGGKVRETEGVDYVRGRGLLPCPVALPIRFHPQLNYWHQRKVPGKKKREPYVLFSGPVMMAPITDPDGRFSGVHITYIDPARPGEKIRVEDPEADVQEGEERPCVAPKKIRGSQSRATIKLWTPERFDRLVMGEGWETTASVLVAEHGTDRFDRTAYWVAINLQNMGGRAAAMVAHPEEKDKAGRPRRVPGPEPDMDDDRAIPIPDCVSELVLLGDGDSDRFTADQVMQRAIARYARKGRAVTPRWAPDGMDFNDILKKARETA
jgi:hypothetical protein